MYTKTRQWLANNPKAEYGEPFGDRPTLVSADSQSLSSGDFEIIRKPFWWVISDLGAAFIFGVTSNMSAKEIALGQQQSPMGMPKGPVPPGPASQYMERSRGNEAIGSASAAGARGLARVIKEINEGRWNLECRWWSEQTKEQVFPGIFVTTSKCSRFWVQATDSNRTMLNAQQAAFYLREWCGIDISNLIK
jgi:hypothetical protein